MSARSYAILGTGALGGFYGAKLEKSGLDVHFLLRSDCDRVREHGLIVESKDGDFILDRVNAYSDVEKMPRCDVVVVALKTTQNHLLPKMLPAVVKDGGVVLVLQNGLGVEEEVAKIVPNAIVIGGLCFLCSNKIAPGHIRHLDYGQITLAEYAVDYHPMGNSPSMGEVGRDFENAGIAIELSEDLLLGRWQKLVWNIPYNGLSVILNAQTDELMSNAYTRKLVEELMHEVANAAKSTGRAIAESHIQKLLVYTEKMKPYRTSMKIDFDSGRSMEVEAIFGNPLRKAEALGASLPLIRCLYQQLKFLDTKTIMSQG